MPQRWVVRGATNGWHGQKGKAERPPRDTAQAPAYNMPQRKPLRPSGWRVVVVSAVVDRGVHVVVVGDVVIDCVVLAIDGVGVVAVIVLVAVDVVVVLVVVVVVV